ncbi:putative glucosylceramidase 4 [Blattella germanica]|nr:putative glucosylceramidase 4 [Blattella germanica]
MLGFGGAITDAVGINLGTLSQEARERLLNQYYGPTGIGYTFVRTPMGGSDFSTRFYTYDDGTADDTLSRFSLASEDHKYKLPYLKYIKLLSNPKVITAPWSPPTWMVESRNGTVGFTRLKDQYYQVMAEYFVNSLQAFKNEGIDVWGVSSQNEPGDGYYAYFGINSCGYSPQEELNFIVNNLEMIYFIVLQILSNATAYEYLYGTAVHWYFDDQYPASRLTELHNNYPNKPIFYTESSFIPDAGQPAVLFGDWGRAEKLSSDMIEELIFFNLNFRNDDNRKIVLQTESGDYMPITVQAHSLNTVLFNNN